MRAHLARALSLLASITPTTYTATTLGTVQGILAHVEKHMPVATTVTIRQCAWCRVLVGHRIDEGDAAIPGCPVQVSHDMCEACVVTRGYAEDAA